MLRDNQTHFVSIGGDTETCDGDANTFQLSLNGKDGHVFFTDKDNIENHFLAVMDSLPRIRNRTYIAWFHNIAFDLPVIFAKRHNLFRDGEFEFKSRGWNVKGIYSHICFVTITKGEKRIELLGTDSYFKTSLAKLAETFCPELPKLEVPKEIGKTFKTAKDKVFVAYAERDSVITQIVGQKIIDMHNKYGIGVSVSAPHMASRIFRRKFLQLPIPLPSMGCTYAALHSYHGGKNNFPIKPGLYKGVSCVDIKSAYPYAMSLLPSFSNRDLYMKFQSKGKVTHVPVFGVYKCNGFARLTPWPVLYDHGFKPVYGQFENLWVTGFEINQAISSGLVDIISVDGYFYDSVRDNCASPFKSYVDHFYSQKEKKGIPKWERDFYKLLMNSLYGKFIESRGASSLLNIKYDIDKEEIQFSLELVAGGLFNPFIATLITGHTRAYIHALETKYQAIHTSTDGIMIRSKAEGLSGELGGISIEAKGDVLLLRNKLYIVYTKDKTKAAKNKAGRILKSRLYPHQYIQKYALHGFFADVSTLEEMVKTGVREYEYVKVNKLRESLRRNLKVNRFEKQQRQLNVDYKR